MKEPGKSKVSWAERIQRIDNRILYAVVFVMLTVPLVMPLGLPMSVAPNTKKAFDIINNLPEGSLVFHSVGFDPSADAELWPQMQALTKHFMSRGLKVVYFSTSVGGGMYAQAVRDKLAPEFGYEYGKDYAILPFKAGGEPAIAAMGDFYKLYSVDTDDTPIRSLPIFKGFTGMGDVSLITTSSNGDDALFLIRHIESKFHTPIIVGGAGTLLPVVGPYLASGQLQAIITGLSGAAEYEILSEIPGQAGGAMDAQAIGHLFIVGLILLGNAGFAAQKITASKKGGS